MQLNLDCRLKSAGAPAFGSPVGKAEDCDFDNESRCEKFDTCATCTKGSGCNWCPGSLITSDTCTASVCDDAVSADKCPVDGLDDKCASFETCSECADGGDDFECHWCNVGSANSFGVVNVHRCRDECEEKLRTPLDECPAARATVSLSLLLALVISLIEN